ncbi:MAG: hypothetical protein SFU25_05010 [Candidatus Caenarcaniphilales bacterium]|nr:hypothetical protein [Candidatus Caenarcaniphilales bacterium]
MANFPDERQEIVKLVAELRSKGTKKGNANKPLKKGPKEEPKIQKPQQDLIVNGINISEPARELLKKATEPDKERFLQDYDEGLRTQIRQEASRIQARQDIEKRKTK